MVSWVGRLRFAMLIGFCILPTGCTVVDKFGDRGVEYNAQMLDVQNKALLLNIVRASLRHPLVFTSLATANGTANSSGQLGLSLPFIQNAVNSPFLANPQASVSGGPSFVLNNLDTQEFTQGILTPIPMQTVDYYVQEGLPPQLIYYLLIGKILFIGDDGLQVGGVYNSINARNDEFPSFQSLIKAMSELKMRTEEVDLVKDIGPLLVPKDLENVEAMTKADQAGLIVAAIDVGDLPKDVAAPFKASGIRQVYQLRKISAGYRFCFDAPIGQTAKFNVKGREYVIALSAGSLCGAANAIATQEKNRNAVGSKSGATDSQIHLMELTAGISRRDENGNLTVARKFAIYPRSTEGVIYYLGELVRAQHGGDPLHPDLSPVQVATGSGQETLFDVRTGESATDSLVAVTYLDKTYSLSAAADRGDRSAQVLNIVTQLINLNKSAKDIPAASVVTLVGR